ncbi:MAG: phenylalanine--tRNA ligase subunit alpha [Flavobacteriales bacterium]|jgi:phenylalanyl-tRNA synthetase alpha chain
MKEKIALLKEKIQSVRIKTPEDAEKFRVAFLGAKGELKALYQELKTVPDGDKKTIGQEINALKKMAEDVLNQIDIEEVKTDKKHSNDLSRPTYENQSGTLHPLTLVKSEIVSIFEKIGFSISEGPEIEDDWHNFSALNFPADHPARDMQDTFFIDCPNPELSLRTHTSSVQVRVMENQKPPIRTISPGRVYRNEAISARAHCFFHQIEGLYIDKNVKFSDLKQTLAYFAKAVFGDKAKIRLRSSYFPFTEPSAEVDVSCSLCESKGCSVCKNSGWLEIMGCGMVDPNVLSACGIDPTEYSGFAFGMGLERIAQLKYRVSDLRLYSENDRRFLQQFQY